MKAITALLLLIGASCASASWENLFPLRAKANPAAEDIPDKNVKYDQWSAKGAYVVRVQGYGSSLFAYRATFDAEKKRARTDIVKLPVIAESDDTTMDSMLKDVLAQDSDSVWATGHGSEFIVFTTEEEGYVLSPGRGRRRGGEDEEDSRRSKYFVDCYKFPMKFRKMEPLKNARFKDLSFHDGHLTHHYTNVTADEESGKKKYELIDSELFIDAFDKSIREFFMEAKFKKGRGGGRDTERRENVRIDVDLRNKEFMFEVVEEAFNIPETVKKVCKQRELQEDIPEEIEEMLLPFF